MSEPLWDEPAAADSRDTEAPQALSANELFYDVGNVARQTWADLWHFVRHDRGCPKNRCDDDPCSCGLMAVMDSLVVIERKALTGMRAASVPEDHDE